MTRIEYLLVTLAEECCEVAQRATKALRFGMNEVQPGQMEDNVRRLERELADTVAVAEMLGLKIRDEDKAAKREKVEKYMVYSHQMGILELMHDDPGSPTRTDPVTGLRGHHGVSGYKSEPEKPAVYPICQKCGFPVESSEHLSCLALPGRHLEF